jgi:release factor glutamine methyltransferase
MTLRAEVGPPQTVGSLLDEAAGVLPSRAEARWVVANVIGVGPSVLPTVFEEAAPAGAADAARALVARRLSGEPLQYVLGNWAFRTLDVHVDRRVLVPRPETEVVTGVALDELRRQAGRSSGRERLVAVDLGTGSGVIGLSLAAEWDGVAASRPRPRLEVWATDVSTGALEVFATNLETLRDRDTAAAGRVQVASGSWFDALPPALVGGVDLIVSNPPYVAASEWPELDVSVRDYEPEIALVAGPTGCEALETLLVGARRWLAPHGALVAELAPHQATDLRRVAVGLGYVSVKVRPDLAGRDRVLLARPTGD